MATASELQGVLAAFKESVNGNPSVQKLVKGWNTKILLWAKDINSGFLLLVSNGALTLVEPTTDPNAAMVRVVTDSDVMLRMFSGKEKIVSAYLDGTIETYGPVRDQMRLDGVAEALWG